MSAEHAVITHLEDVIDHMSADLASQDLFIGRLVDENTELEEENHDLHAEISDLITEIDEMEDRIRGLENSVLYWERAFFRGGA